MNLDMHKQTVGKLEKRSEFGRKGIILEFKMALKGLTMKIAKDKQ